MVTLRVLDLVIDVPDPIGTQWDGFAPADGPAELAVSAESPAVALAELTTLAVRHSDLLCLHAAVVASPRGLLVVPGASGLGKTTLAAALVRAGFGYVSDEVLALDRRTGRATAFPRPLGLDAAAWPVLGLPGDPPPPGTERLLPPGVFGQVAADGGPVSDIVLAQRRPGPVEFEPATSRGAAVVALLDRSFNHFRDPPGSFRATVALARTARVWQAGYESAPELADVLAARIPAAATVAR